MTRSELTEELFRRLPPYFKLKLPKSVLKMVMDFLLDIIIEQLLIGEPVQLRGYFTLDPKLVRGKVLVDKDTKERRKIKPYLSIRVRLSRKWRDKAKKMIRGE